MTTGAGGDSPRSPKVSAACRRDHAVTGCADVVSLWWRINNRFPLVAVEQVVGSMLKALGAELEAPGAREDSVRLALVLRDVAHLRALVGVHEQVSALLQGLRGVAGVSGAEVNEMVGQFVTLCGMRGATREDVMRLEGFSGSTDRLCRIHFFRRLIQLVRRSPLIVFRGDDQRLTVLASCQAALDKLIDEIEEGRRVGGTRSVDGISV